MTKLICGWCREGFEMRLYKDKHDERNLIVCPNCGRLLPSSRKEPTGNLVGRKHLHVEWRDGDII